MEIEFFCHPKQSPEWYQYWRDRRYRWYTELGLAERAAAAARHDKDELSHYSCGTADIEYAFPFLPPGEFGELEGIAHRGDFDLRSHMEGKLVRQGDELVVEQGRRRQAAASRQRQGFELSRRSDGRAVRSARDRAVGRRRSGHAGLPVRGLHRGRGAGRKRQDAEPRGDEVPSAAGADQGGRVSAGQKRRHARSRPGDLSRAEDATSTCSTTKKGRSAAAIAARTKPARRICITVDGQTLTDGTVTIRDRDTLKQWRIHKNDCLAEIKRRLAR